MVLAQQGLDDWEIAERMRCTEGDVRRCKQRAMEAARKPKPVTLHFRIIELARQGASDGEIADELGCRLEYIRVARQRAGLCQRRGKRAANSNEAMPNGLSQRKAA